MVVRVEVQSGPSDTSLLALPHRAPTSNNATNLSQVSITMEEAARDTSQASRADNSAAMENSRVTVNTYNSILNLTEDEEDDDGLSSCAIDRSFLFEDMMMISSAPSSLDQSFEQHENHHTMSLPETPPMLSSKQCARQDVPAAMTTTPSLLDQVTEHFVDTLCFRGGELTTSSDDVVNNENNLTWEGYRRLLEHDILELLGCASPPDEDEMEQIWAPWNHHSNMFGDCNKGSSGNATTTTTTIPSPPRRPRRHSLRDRALLVHRLRQERAMPVRTTGLSSPSPSPTSVTLPRTTRSMDEKVLQSLVVNHCKNEKKKKSLGIFTLDEDLEQYIGVGGIDPIGPSNNNNGDEVELGYDSDPGEFSFTEDEPATADYLLHPSPIRARSPSKLRGGESPSSLQNINDKHLPATVQESMNLTWTLTWHPGAHQHHQSTTAAAAANGHPVTINAWIERGTLVHNYMLEPNLMWREAYQPDLCSKRKLNVSTQKPFSIKLLNLCRIVNAERDDEHDDLDRSLYPLARPKSSFFVRTSDGQEYLFEAADPQQRDDAARRWKLCVARFATLAVLEDVDGLAREFFAPVVTSQMLVPNYYKHYYYY